MSGKYYLKNIIWGVIFFSIIAYVFYGSQFKISYQCILIYSIVSCILYPFSKISIETLALKFSSRDFWSTGFFAPDIGTYSIYSIFFLFCFVLAIPFSILFLFLHTKKTG